MGHIRGSESPWSCPVFFIHKKDGSFRLVQDYCNINKWTERDVYPMPRIDLILEQLHGKTIFTALDIRDGYNNIRIQLKDRWKLAFKGPDGHYEPACMFFGMSNTPAVFQRCMDWIFAPLKARYPGCIFVYMNNMLITMGEDQDLHEQIVHDVLDMLAREDFYLKLSKCLFHQHDICYDFSPFPFHMPSTDHLLRTPSTFPVSSATSPSLPLSHFSSSPLADVASLHSYLGL